MKNPITFLVVLIIAGIIAFDIKSWNHVETIVAKVEGKERITEKSGDNTGVQFSVIVD